MQLWLWNYVSIYKNTFMIGDWNQLLSATDKFGGLNVERKLSSQFWKVINACQLRDLGFSGSKYTWVNKRSGTGLILEWLDRAFSNDLGFQKFHNLNVKHLAWTSSDHHPLLLSGNNERRRRATESPFRMQIAWYPHPDFANLVQTHWEETGGNFM